MIYRKGTTMARFILLLLLMSLCCLSAGQEVTSEPEPSPEPEQEPEGTPEPEPEGVPGLPELQTYSEPEPYWPEAKQKWGSLWEVHIYLFGVAFGVVALYSLLSIIRLYKRKHLLSQPYFISLNSLVFLMGSLRSIYLLVDAYNTKETFPPFVAYILYTLFLPSVTSAFSLLFMSLLAATKMQFISPSIQKVKVIVFIVVVHFGLAITADILTAAHLDASIVMFVCQIFYIIWGLFLFVGFMYLFGQLYKAAKDRQVLMNKYAMRKLGLPPSKQNKKPEHHKLTLSLGTILTLISSILGFLTVILLIYGMVDVYGVFEKTKTPEAWRWWGYHTAFRALELAICITMSYIATQPFRYPSPGSGDSSKGSTCSCTKCYAICAPCWSWCNREHTYLLPDVGWSELHSEVESGTLKRNESQKNDYPLHHVHVRTDEEGQSNALKSPMLKADHGQLMFSSSTDTYRK